MGKFETKKPTQAGWAGLFGRRWWNFGGSLVPDRIHTSKLEGLSGEISEKYAPTGAPKKPLPWIVQVRFLGRLVADQRCEVVAIYGKMSLNGLRLRGRR